MKIQLEIESDPRHERETLEFVGAALFAAFGPDFKMWHVVSSKTKVEYKFDPIAHDGNPPEASGVDR